MKLLLISSLFLLSLNSIASKNAQQGQVISSDKFNSSTLSIGSIQHSILSVSQFQSINGNCWRQMDGSSLSGTDLGQLVGSSMTNLPDLRTKGEFLRQAPQGVAVGTIQEDAIRDISGTFQDYTTFASDWNVGGAFTKTNSSSNSGWTGHQANSRPYSTIHFKASNVVPTAPENRPVNLSVNIFIKVNNTCSIN